MPPNDRVDVGAGHHRHVEEVAIGIEEPPQVGRVAPLPVVLRGLQEGDRQVSEVDSSASLGCLG